MKYIVYFLLPLFFVGCYEKHDVKPTFFTKENVKLDKSKTVYISVPEDGVYGSIIYKKSGHMTVEAIKSALVNHIHSIKEGREVESYNIALENAQEKGAEYLIFPVILQWVERVTELSGKPDKITIQISVFDVKTDSEISLVLIKSEGSFWLFEGGHPQDLLKKPISQYIDSLYE